MLKKAPQPHERGRGESPDTWLCLRFGSGHQITVWTMALHSAAQVLNDQEVAMSGPVGGIPWVRSALTGPGPGWMAGEHVGGNKAGGHPAGARIVLWCWKQRDEGERWETTKAP